MRTETNLTEKLTDLQETLGGEATQHFPSRELKIVSEFRFSAGDNKSKDQFC